MRREFRPRVTAVLVLLGSIAGLLTSGCTSRAADRASSSHDEPFSPISSATVTPIPKPSAVLAPIRKSSSRDIAPCRAQHLSLTYYGGGAGAGNDFGAIQIRNVGGEPCQLLGPIQLIGLDRHGNPVTQALTYAVGSNLNLSPRAAAHPPGQPPTGDVTASLSVAAYYRDDPSSPNGLCQQRRVIPALWRVRFRDGSRNVANASIDLGYPAFSSLITCGGQLDTPSPISTE